LWRNEKRKQRAKQQQSGGGRQKNIIPPSPVVPYVTTDEITELVKHAQHAQQLGGSLRQVERGTIIPEHEVIAVRGRPTVFSHPTQILITGPTKTGKTTLVSNMLIDGNRDKMFIPNLQEVYWFYTMPGSIVGLRDKLPGVHFVRGYPTIDKFTEMDPSVPKLVVLDDLMEMTDKKSSYEDLKRLFSAISHHCNVSVVFIVQDLYVNRNMTRLANQSEHVISMCNGAAAYQVSKLASKLFGAGYEAFIRWVIADIRDRRSHGYILMSTEATLPEIKRIRSCILPSDPENLFYLKKGTLRGDAYWELVHDQEADGATHVESGTDQIQTQISAIPPDDRDSQ